MTVRIEDLKVGMKVKLVDSKKLSSGIVWGAMEQCLGRVYTIELVDILHKCITLKENKSRWVWGIRFVEKIVDDKEKKNKVYRSLKEIKENSIEETYIKFIKTYYDMVGSCFAFEKCIVNDNCTIGIFRGARQIYKGIAKCQPDDEFSLAKGFTIAMLRAYKDYLDRQIKSLY